MIFSTLIINKQKPIINQIVDHVINAIEKGEIKKDSKLPSTRELSTYLKVSRNSVIAAYEELESKGIIISKRGKGTFIAIDNKKAEDGYNVDWNNIINYYGKTLHDEDIMKTELKYKKGMISFKSIAPDDSLFNIEDFKRSFLDAFSFEGANLINYGYAKGYKPLIDFLLNYMKDKGVNINNKDIVITNGFTEAFDIIIQSLTKEGDIIFCEKPTHNTALKIMRAHNLNIVQIPMDSDGIKIDELEKAFEKYKPKFGYIIPSYNNPTGIVTKSERRKQIFNLFKKYSVPIIEDGFNEELLYSSSPIEPMAALSENGNSTVYIGSLSKILFPGLRIGWILADKKLIDYLESVKRGRSIHVSFLDQAIFYYYLKSGAFNKYLKSVRKSYKDKYRFIIKMINENLSYKYITGEGGLHLFVKLNNNLNARELLDNCYKRNVIFMPGDVFFENGGEDTFRLGFGRLNKEQIEQGIKIIGEEINKLEKRG